MLYRLPKIFTRQTKLGLCVLIALSGAFGYILTRALFERGLVMTILAMPLVAGVAVCLKSAIIKLFHSHSVERYRHLFLHSTQRS